MTQAEVIRSLLIECGDLVVEAVRIGDQRSCQELERMKESEAYQADKFRSEHHLRTG